jgi:hypothetical protein
MRMRKALERIRTDADLRRGDRRAQKWMLPGARTVSH